MEVIARIKLGYRFFGPPGIYQRQQASESILILRVRELRTQKLDRK